jgi:hypothetical protein
MSVKSESFKFSIGLALALIVFLCLIAGTFFWMTDPLNFRAPSDEELLKIFQEHKEEFETLKTMMTEDSKTEKKSSIGWYVIAKAFAISELGESQTQKLIPAGKTLHLVMASMSIDDPAECFLMDLFHELGECHFRRLHSRKPYSSSPCRSHRFLFAASSFPVSYKN